MTEIFNEIKCIENEIINHRRNLHRKAEVGFDLPETVAYISKSLKEIGCNVYNCGNNGIYTVIGNKESENCILLRADMDALPLKEETDLEFKANNAMHACGHDMHSAMLLGAAKILKMHENELSRPVKLLFQPAEEILLGAKNMIDNGILDNPKVTSAFMLHVVVNTPIKSGVLIVSNSGVGAPATNYFEIEINGKGCHGAMPNTGIDPIIAASDIVRALDSVKSRELSLYDNSVLTIGSFISGTTHNVIPDKASIKGTFRSFDMNVQQKIESSLIRISNNIAAAYNCSADITFPTKCPCLINNEELSRKTVDILTSAIDKEHVITASEIKTKSRIEQRSAGSEDFSYFSTQTPSLMLALSAGSTDEGYMFPLHHPKTTLDENCLVYGTAALSIIGMKI